MSFTSDNISASLLHRIPVNFVWSETCRRGVPLSKVGTHLNSSFPQSRSQIFAVSQQEKYLSRSKLIFNLRTLSMRIHDLSLALFVYLTLINCHHRRRCPADWFVLCSLLQIPSSSATLTFGEFLINIIRQLWWEIYKIPLFSSPDFFPCTSCNSHINAVSPWINDDIYRGQI